MRSYEFISRRVLQSLPILFGVTLLCFALFHMVGGDPSYFLAGKQASPERISSIRAELGLDAPLWRQYVFFLKQIFSMDWGTSWYTNEPVVNIIYRGLGPSLCLTLPAFLLSSIIAFVFALISAHAHIAKKIYGLWIRVACVSLMSVSYLVLVIGFQFIFAFSLGMFVISGWDEGILERWAFLALPIFIITLASIGPNTLLFRSILLSELTQNYVKTGLAKGLTKKDLLLRHVFKNSLIPISTTLFTQFPSFLLGSLLVESFFGLPGIGDLLLKSIQTADFPVIKAMTVLTSITYIIITTISDVVLSVFDPRVRVQ